MGRGVGLDPVSCNLPVIALLWTVIVICLCALRRRSTAAGVLYA